MIPTPRAKDAFVDSNSSHVNYWLDNFYGNVEGGVFDVTEDLKRLPENKCKFVMLCNWNAADDLPTRCPVVMAEVLTTPRTELDARAQRLIQSAPQPAQPRQ